MRVVDAFVDQLNLVDLGFRRGDSCVTVRVGVAGGAFGLHVDHVSLAPQMHDFVHGADDDLETTQRPALAATNTRPPPTSCRPRAPSVIAAA